MNRSLAKTKTMILCALFAALTAVCSQIVLPLPFTPIPVNLATLAVVLCGTLLGPCAGTASQLVYLLLGTAGLPVFTQMQGGFSVLAGPTGGYLIGYLLAAFVTGTFIRHSKKRFWEYTLAMAVGMFTCYLCGTAWFMLQTHSPLYAALVQCVLPFLPGDCIKIAAGSLLAKRLAKSLPFS